MPRFPARSAAAQALPATSFGPFQARMAEVQAEGRLIPLHLGDTWVLPPEPARRIDLDREELHRYVAVPGLPRLRAAVAERLAARYAIPTATERVFITPGSTGGLSIAASALFEPGDEVLVLTPSWPLIFGILSRQGIVVREVSVGPDGAPETESEAFAARLDAAITEKTAGIYFCDPNNPAGFIYPEPYLRAIAERAERHALWILSDIAYVDLAFEPFKAAAARPDMAERCVTAGTFSKTLALAGHRVGYLTGPPAVAELIARLICHSSYHASSSAQEMALACLTAGREGEVAESYAAGAAIAHAELRGRFRPAQAGAFVFLDLRPRGVSNEEEALAFLIRCLDAGVSLCPGRIFGAGFAAFARLCFTAVPPQRLREGLARIKPLLEG